MAKANCCEAFGKVDEGGKVELFCEMAKVLIDGRSGRKGLVFVSDVISAPDEKENRGTWKL